jgi:opine dehydrogenase
MVLAVLGPSLDRTLPVAAVASLTSGETVLVDRADHATLTITGNGFDGRAVLAPYERSRADEVSAYVVAAGAEEQEEVLHTNHERFADTPVLLAPGGFGGALVYTDRFAASGAAAPRLSEVPGWMVGGRRDGGTLTVFIRKRNLPIAGIDDAVTVEAVETFGRWFPDLVPSDLVTTSLSNINALIHPPLALLNATRIENGETWHYWDEGMTPAVHRLMCGVDAERGRVLTALGTEHVPLMEMAIGAYGNDGMRGETFYDAVKAYAPYRRRVGPVELHNPFLTDDVPFGIAAYEALARKLGTPHDVLTAVRTLAETVLGRSLSADPNAVDALLEYATSRGAGTHAVPDCVAKG